MDRQKEYEIRQEISNYIRHKIMKKLDDYYNCYKDNAGFLIYYPLIFLENRFFTTPFKFAKEFASFGFDETLTDFILPSMYKDVTPDRIAITWFIKQMMERGYNFKGRFFYNSDEYEEFLSNIELIKLMYADYRKSDEIKIMRSIAKIQLNEIDNNTYNIFPPIISDEYSKENIYFYGLDDEDQTQKELLMISKLDNYLLVKYNFFEDFFNMNFKSLDRKKKEIKSLKHNIDFDFLNLCIDRVAIDINKIGINIQSQIISDKIEFKKILGSLYYLSRVNLHYCNLMQFLQNEYLHDLFIRTNINALINKIQHMTNIPRNKIRDYLEYFYLEFDKDGILTEFPLVKFNNTIVFIPSSFMLNDFQFSVINGHYFKKIDIINRDSTVSQSIIDRILNKTKKFSNIIMNFNKEYFVQDVLFEGKEFKSDIDIAFYDKISNTLLIIECKWKENVYLLHEDFIKIESAVSKIFRNQLGKHKQFIQMSDDNIDFIFDNNIDVKKRNATPDIEYIFVDKRIQLHLQDNHTLSEFMLLQIFEEFSEKNILNLHKVTEEIRRLETKISYNIPEKFKEMIINNKKYLHDFFIID